MLSNLFKNFWKWENTKCRYRCELNVILIHYCCAKSLRLCPTLCDLMKCSPPSSLSMGFSRQEYWSGLPCPSPGDLPNLGSNQVALPALAGGCFTTWGWGMGLCHLGMGLEFRLSWGLQVSPSILKLHIPHDSGVILLNMCHKRKNMCPRAPGTTNKNIHHFKN